MKSIGEHMDAVLNILGFAVVLFMLITGVVTFGVLVAMAVDMFNNR